MAATVTRSAVSGGDVFLEVELDATAPTGDPVKAGGVMVFGLEGSLISTVTAYMFRENVELEAAAE